MKIFKKITAYVNTNIPELFVLEYEFILWPRLKIFESAKELEKCLSGTNEKYTLDKIDDLMEKICIHLKKEKSTWKVKI
jgi:hypothetical protein